MKMKYVLIPLITLILAYACSNERPSQAQSGSAAMSGDEAPKGNPQALLRYLPEEVNLVFYANYGQLRQTPFGREFQNNDWEYNEFVEKTGIDPRNDVYEICVGGILKDEHDEDEDVGVVVHGNIDEERLIAHLREQNEDVRPLKLNGEKVYVLDRKDDAQMAFLDDGMIAMGKSVWLQRLLKNKSSDRSVLSDARMDQFINEVPKGAQVWGVVDLDEVSEGWAEQVRKRSSSFKGTQSIENMRSIMFYTEIDDAADFNLRGNFDTQEEAELLSEALNGFKALAKLMIADDKEAVDMLNEIKIKASGYNLSVNALIDKAFIDKAREKQEKIKNGDMELL